MESADTKEVFERVVRWFAAHGGHVVCNPAGENLIRSRTAQDPHDLPWVVEVQGWPNLIHELVHVLFAGRLAEDSGFDYAQIPLSLANARHRAWLWDELSACTLSCRYFTIFAEKTTLDERMVDLPSFTASDVSDDRRAQVRAWFDEQVEILPLFYGMGGDLPAFSMMVDQTLLQHRAEFDAIFDRAAAQVASVVGSSPISNVDFSELWRPFVTRVTMANRSEQDVGAST